MPGGEMLGPPVGERGCGVERRGEVLGRSWRARASPIGYGRYTMLVEGRPRAAVFTNVESPKIDATPYETGAGRCLDAFRHQQPYRIRDIAADLFGTAQQRPDAPCGGEAERRSRYFGMRSAAVPPALDVGGVMPSVGQDAAGRGCRPMTADANAGRECSVFYESR